MTQNSTCSTDMFHFFNICTICYLLQPIGHKCVYHDQAFRCTHMISKLLAHQPVKLVIFENMEIHSVFLIISYYRCSFCDACTFSRIEWLNARGRARQGPAVVRLYNKHMGGVDLGDQILSYYDPDHKSLKLWKRILMTQLMTATSKKDANIS